MSAETRANPSVAFAGGGLLASALLTAALFASAFATQGVGLMPFGFLAVFAPTPLVLFRLRATTSAACLATLLGAVLLVAICPPAAALVFIGLTGAPAMLMGEALARGRGLYRGCAWAFVMIAVEISAALVTFGSRLAAPLLAPFEQLRSPAGRELLRQQGFSSTWLDAATDQALVWERALRVVYPACFVLAGGLLVLLNAGLVRAYLARRYPDRLAPGGFERLRWPLGLAVVFVISVALLAAPPLHALAYNLLLFVAVCFALQGLAVAVYVTRRLSLPFPLRLALLILACIHAWAPQVLAVAGLLDLWLDMRGLMARQEDTTH